VKKLRPAPENRQSVCPTERNAPRERAPIELAGLRAEMEQADGASAADRRSAPHFYSNLSWAAGSRKQAFEEAPGYSCHPRFGEICF
jgi:hypothetical protein